MSPETEDKYTRALESVTRIVSVYLERHATLPPEQVPGFIEGVFQVLLREGGGEGAGGSTSTPTTGGGAAAGEGGAPSPAEGAQKPAVAVEDSITADYLICLEDGSKVKLLKRYLRSKYNMTPRQYREKWSLPKDYPMTAPSYSQHRASIAHSMGLGGRRTGRGAAAEAAPAAAESAGSRGGSGGQGRGRKKSGDTGEVSGQGRAGNGSGRRGRPPASESSGGARRGRRRSGE